MTRFGGFKRAARKLSKLSSKFYEAASQVTDSVEKGSEETAEQVASTATRLAPRSARDQASLAASDARLGVAERSGRLKRSIDYTQLDDGTWVIGSPLDYAEWVERGRGPITPTDADALKFPAGGETVFAKRVGPAEPQPFLRPALMRHRGDYTDNLENELEIMFKDVFD